MRLRQKGLKGGESISGSKSSEADSEISAPLVQAIVAMAHRWCERHTAEWHTAGVSGTPLNHGDGNGRGHDDNEPTADVSGTPLV